MYLLLRRSSRVEDRRQPPETWAELSLCSGLKCSRFTCWRHCSVTMLCSFNFSCNFSHFVRFLLQPSCEEGTTSPSTPPRRRPWAEPFTLIWCRLSAGRPFPHFIASTNEWCGRLKHPASPRTQRFLETHSLNLLVKDKRNEFYLPNHCNRDKCEAFISWLLARERAQAEHVYKGRAGIWLNKHIITFCLA